MSLMAKPTPHIPPSNLANQRSARNLRLNHSESPLTSLVRRTSSRRARQTAATRDQQQLNTPRIQETQEDAYVQDSYDYNYNYTRQTPSPTTPEDDAQYAYAHRPSGPQSSSYSLQSHYSQPGPYSPGDGNAQNALQPPHREMGHLQLDIQPANQSLTFNGLPSPLLHSQFSRDSFATASSSDGHSYWDPDSSGIQYSNPSSPSSRRGDEEDFEDGSSEYGRCQYFPDDTSSIYSTGNSRGPALRDSWNSTATGATVRRPDYYIPNANLRTPSELRGVGSPPSIVISSATTNEGEVERETSILRAGPGWATVVKPAMPNFSRPVRLAEGERVTPQLPPDMREQKMKVLERNARGRRSGSPTGSRTPTSTVRPTYESEYSRPSLDSTRSNATLAETRHVPTSSPNLQPLSQTTARSASPLSLYSTYSYYPYEDATPSPTGSQLVIPQQQPAPEKGSAPRTPQDYLQLGIQHHEANRLAESARCFERSANEGGGCGVGMLMYGLTLRHGWGCWKNEKVGFKWLMKAAECAVGDLEKVRTGGGEADVGVVETELVLAIYEVGQCFFHGWGVAKDQKMAVSYYAIAARLGDGDAQADLAYCLANGKGCKKDKKEAAKWYKQAISQGQSDVGLAWIYKDKYQ